MKGPLMIGKERLSHFQHQLRVVLMSDNYFLLQGGRALLKQWPEINLVGGFQRADQLIHKMVSSQAESIVVDIDSLWPTQLEGVIYLHSLYKTYPKLRIIVLSSHLLPALLYGVAAVVNKQDIEALRVALLTRRPPGRASRAPIVKGVKALTPRERLVLNALMSGKRLRQIAREEGKSLTTVSSQKSSALSKLGVGSVQELFTACRKKVNGKIKDAHEKIW